MTSDRSPATKSLRKAPLAALSGGSNAGDQVGSGGIQKLYNPANYTLSNYLIKSPGYASGAGAITWASGTGAITGTVGGETNGNSIFGNAPTDAIAGSSMSTAMLLRNVPST